MPHVRSSYTLYPRKLQIGVVWYYQTYDDNGRRLPGKSTGKFSKSEARKFCDELLKAERLAAPKCPTLSEWSDERHWFEWATNEDSPTCLYSLGRLARSTSDHPAVQKRYIRDCSRNLRQYILPKFKNIRIDKISPDELEQWMFDIAATGLSTKTVNNISSTFRIMTGEALRLKLITDDPWTRVPMFQASSALRGSLGTAEATVLMDPRTMDTVWDDHRLYYLANLTAMLTGCRQGEIIALRCEDLHPDHIDVSQAWKVKSHQLGPTKGKVAAPVAIPKYLYDELVSFCRWDGFVFSFTGGRTPATGNRLSKAFNDALARIGITEEERKERGLTFHSWRRFCNTYLRARGITDAKIRAQTRHATPGMTDHYTDWKPEDFLDVQAAQVELVLKITQRK